MYPGWGTASTEKLQLGGMSSVPSLGPPGRTSAHQCIPVYPSEQLCASWGCHISPNPSEEAFPAANNPPSPAPGGPGDTPPATPPALAQHPTWAHPPVSASRARGATTGHPRGRILPPRLSICTSGSLRTRRSRRPPRVRPALWVQPSGARNRDGRHRMAGAGTG